MAINEENALIDLVTLTFDLLTPKCKTDQGIQGSTCPPSLVTLPLIVAEISRGQTDRQTDKQTDKQTDGTDRYSLARLSSARVMMFLSINPQTPELFHLRPHPPPMEYEFLLT